MTTRARSAVLVLAAVAAVCAAASEEDLMSKTSTPIIDFTRGDETWPHINDGVMGGVSSGEMVAAAGHATFRGTVSFDNNGGFSSVRSRAEVHDLSAFDGLVVRVRGDGKRYGFRLKTDASFDGVSYQAEISPPAGEWREIAVPFTEFVPVFRGRTVPGHPPLDPSRITTFGLIVSRQEGPFSIDIASIRAYPAAGDRETDR
jgi:monofunctional biosynthetic peptidoglycan transglycosylase